VLDAGGEHVKKKNAVVRICLNCKRKFTSSTSKRYKKCCCIKCAKTWTQKFVDYKQVSKTLKTGYQTGKYKSYERLKKYKICEICGARYLGGRTTCSDECSKIRQKRNRKFISQKISETRKKMFREGSLAITGGTTKWIKYKNIKVQGSYEYRTCVILDAAKEKKEILNWDYTKDRVEYTGIDGKSHNYLLDFKVINNDNTFFYVEVKGFVKDNDYLKWDAVKKNGFKLQVWKKDDILEKEKFYGIVAPM